MIMRKLLMNVVIGLLVLLPLSAYAGLPLDTVRVNADKVLEILRDPALKPASKKEAKKDKLRAIYVNMFDEVELSRRALGKNWNGLNAAQRKEFVLLFRQVLENAYADRILAYANEKITYDRERMLSENQAEISTRVLSASKTIPISYRMIRKGNVWRVYDVVVENISLVQNYRTQFNEMLANNNPEHLLQTLRKKVKES